MPPRNPNPKRLVYRWDDMPRERVNERLERRIISGERLMLTHVYLEKGCIVPLHSHENEQVSYMLSGRLRFWLGSEDAEPFDLEGGQVLVIPSGIPHKAEALEDSVDADIFCPPRQDWLDKTDDYLRRT
jgi:quercetin dioxygenase-like cupin family protein